MYSSIHRTFLQLTFWAIATIWATSINCQSLSPKGSISASWFTFVAPKQEIIPNYDASRKDVSISSSPRASFAGKLQYNHSLNKHFDLSLGITVGSYPFDINYAYDSLFSISSTKSDDFFYDKYSSVYGGIGFSVTYFQKLAKKQSLAIKLGCNYTIFIPQFYIYSHGVSTDHGIYETVFTDANMNPEEKAFFAPEVGIQYYYEAVSWLKPFVSLNGVYSNNYPIIGNRYIVFGKTENVEGTFRRRFLQAGIEVGVKVSMPPQRKK